MRTGKLWVLGGAAVTGMLTLLGVGAYTTTGKMVNVALDRELPAFAAEDKFSVSGTGMPPQLSALREAAARQLEESGCETVTITARDGVKLTGHLHRCENAARTVVAMHGWRSTWARDFGMVAEFFFKNRCNVLFAEQRAQGNSEGQYITFGLMERFDCLDWVNWLNRQGFENTPIYLIGISMGATTVLMTTGLPLPENVRGVIADCGFTSADAIWKHVAKENLHIAYGQLRGMTACSLCKRKIQLSPEAYSCPDALQNCKVPVLFIHGTEDRFVPIAMTYENYLACSAPRHLLVVPGAEHGQSYLLEKNKYEQTVKRFWQTYDGPK